MSPLPTQPPISPLGATTIEEFCVFLEMYLLIDVNQ